METTIVATYTAVHAAATALPDAAIVVVARLPWESWCGIKDSAGRRRGALSGSAGGRPPAMSHRPKWANCGR